MASESRLKSNAWLKISCKNITGKVLSIGSLDDKDGEGSFYRNYFIKAEEYLTSEVREREDCDLVLDITNMDNIKDNEFDCIFCCGVLEHVYDFHKGIAEISRIMKKGGVLLLGLPFNQAIHMPPNDFWRFTEYGIRKILSENFNIKELKLISVNNNADFPETYWIKAIKTL